MPPTIREHEWQQGLCDCFSGGNCLMGTCCPCLLVQKTGTWLSDPSKEDPSGCGGTCAIYTLLQYTFTGGFIVEWGQRRAIRKRYGINDGNGCTDCLKPWCCPCCAAIQEYTELEKRREAGVYKQGYQMQAPMGMSAAPPAHH
ncbi:PLAC8 family-domain-containing protein [Apodospora peruviana]|uniref:PLAC8 family-domain-containing protein n=1 Tax=Apodospora peruviana TaxID=516989 RepID=A0AAE0M414_9PEZI|nr:PLAC8 family-domain-containing protein [Apodospora peruviana]